MRTVEIKLPCTAAPFYIAASVGETIELTDELAEAVVDAGKAKYVDSKADKKPQSADKK